MVIHIQTNMMGSGMGNTQVPSMITSNPGMNAISVITPLWWIRVQVHRYAPPSGNLIAFQISYLLITEDVDGKSPITILPRRYPPASTAIAGCFSLSAIGRNATTVDDIRKKTIDKSLNILAVFLFFIRSPSPYVSG